MENKIIQEDTINIKEIFLLLWIKKRFIFFLTIIIVIISILYVYSKPPTYIAKSTLEIGNINTDLLENPQQLIRKTRIFYKNNHLLDKHTSIIKISLIRRTKNLIDINIRANSKENAIKDLQTIISHIKTLHDKKIANYLGKHQKKINKLKSEKNQFEKEIVEIQNEITNLKLLIKQLTQKSPTIAAIHSLNLNSYIKELSIINNKILNLDNKLFSLKETLFPDNINETNILGEINTKLSGIRSKTLSTIVITSLSGFILSIFLVLFMNFIKTLRKEES